MGMRAGVVGTLIAVSKLFDGITDIFFGAMIDNLNQQFPTVNYEDTPHLYT